MASLKQKWIPGIVGISTYVDFAYQKEMQLAAVAAAGTSGPINQLKTVTVTLDFSLLVSNLQAGKRSDAEEQLAAAVQLLQIANADFIVVTSGTTSTLTRLARQRISIPILDIADATFKQERPAGPVGLLATSFTVAGEVFHGAAKRHGAALIVPTAESAARVDETIFSELVGGPPSASCVAVFRGVIKELETAGAASIILGNTDLTLIAAELQQTAAVPLIDAARAHAKDAARAALTGQLA